MAGETIIIVDDVAVNLKLAATVLRGEAFKVRVASNAEEAITMMRTTVPDLLLVDIQLPGMNGLDLTRHVRQDPRTRELVVVALTASVMPGAEQLAYDAGCDGFISKPIDTRTLGARIRSFLEGRTNSVAEPAIAEVRPPGRLSFCGPEMEVLRRSFLAEGSSQVRRLTEFVSTRFDIGQAARMFHQWVGSAGALGYMEIAERARAAELLLSSDSWAAVDLRDALAALLQAFLSPREAGETPIPDAIIQELSRKRFALIGFADEEAERLCSALGRAQALPRVFTGEEPPQCHPIMDCSVVMVHVRQETLRIPWLQADFRPAQPVVLVGGREDLLGLPIAVQARACEFLIDGWQPEEVIMRLSLACSRGQMQRSVDQPAVDGSGSGRRQGNSGRPEIFIADDDVHVRTLVHEVLQSQGMDCRSAASGAEALTMIRERCPDVAVLDVSMPGMNGFELLWTLRQDGLPLKIVMLTARQHESDVLRGFEMGADDYVVKPFNPLELAARLKRLL